MTLAQKQNLRSTNSQCINSKVHYRCARNSGTDADSSDDCNEKFWRNGYKTLLGMHPVNDRSWEVLDYWTHFLANKSSLYDEVAGSVARAANRQQAKMRSQMFNSFDPITINFISSFEWSCDMTCVYEESTLLLDFLIKWPATAALNALIALRSKSHNRDMEGTISSYCDAVWYLFDTYATDDISYKQTPIWVNSLSRLIGCVRSMLKHCGTSFLNARGYKMTMY